MKTINCFSFREPTLYIGGGFSLVGISSEKKHPHPFTGLPFYLKYDPLLRDDCFREQFPDKLSELSFRQVRASYVEPKYVTHGDYKYLTLVPVEYCGSGFHKYGDYHFLVDNFRVAYPITLSLVMLLIALNEAIPLKVRKAAFQMCSSEPDSLGIKGYVEHNARDIALYHCPRLYDEPLAEDSMLVQKEKDSVEEISYGPQSGLRENLNIDKVYDFLSHCKSFVMPDFLRVKEATNTCVVAFSDTSTGFSAFSIIFTYVGAIYTGLNIINQFITFINNPLKKKYKPQSGLPDAMIAEALAPQPQIKADVGVDTKTKEQRKPLGFAGLSTDVLKPSGGDTAMLTTPGFTGKTYTSTVFGGGIKYA